MKLSLHATAIIGAIFAVACFSVAITGFFWFDDLPDPQQLADAKGFAGFWAFLGFIAISFAVLARWLARTQQDEQDAK